MVVIVLHEKNVPCLCAKVEVRKAVPVIWSTTETAVRYLVPGTWYCYQYLDGP